MISNVRTVRIEWRHCDPAGIVYYSRFFAIFDTSTTTLFERALGMTKYQFLQHYAFEGYPMVDTGARFRIPLRFGDDVQLRTTVTRIRRSSFRVEHQMTIDGQLAVEAFEVRVWVRRDPNDPKRFKAEPMPREVVDRLSQDICLPPRGES